MFDSTKQMGYGSKFGLDFVGLMGVCCLSSFETKVKSSFNCQVY